MRGRRSTLGIILIAAVVAGACSDDAKVKPKSTTTTPATVAPTRRAVSSCATAPDGVRELQYVNRVGAKAQHNRLDLYTTNSMRCAPVFAFVHGGGYCCGDKRNDIKPVAKWLNAQGYAVASINYRLTKGRAAVKFPAFNDDVAAAIAWLRRHGPAVGVDPDRIVLAGHSTGGQIAAMVGADPQYLNAVGESLASLRCVALLDGSGFDFEAAVRDGNDGVRNLYRTAFGDAVAIAKASPLQSIAKGHDIPPFLIVQRKGDNDTKLPDQVAFGRALQQAGVSVTTVDASAIGHGQVVTNIGKPNDNVMTKPLFAFLTQCANTPRVTTTMNRGTATSATPSTTTPSSSSTATQAGQSTTTLATPAAPLTATTAAATATCTPSDGVPVLNVSFGPAALDIYPTAQRCNAPIALFVHGGGYCCGNKSQISTRTIQWFNAQGYTLVSTNYRLNVVYPAFDNDVAHAIGWLRNHADEYAADASRLVLMGHSTGGAMVGEIGTTPAIMASAGLSLSAIDCVAVLDGTALDPEDLINNSSSSAVVATMKRAYGTDPAVWARASALRNATDGSAVQRFLVVARGTQADTQNQFVAALRANGVSVRTIDASSIGHGQVLNNIGAATDTVMTAPMSAFLSQCD